MTRTLQLLRALPVIVAAVLCLSDCSFGGSSGTYSSSPSLTVTQPRTLGVNQSVVLTASSATGAAFTPVWVVYGPATNSVGSLTGQTGNSITYTAPPAPPIYAAPVPAVPQGQVRVQVTDATGGQSATNAQIVILAPSVTVGISPAIVSVARSGQVSFDVYAVGAVNQAVGLQVNAVVGGNATYGTITGFGNAALYTAPATVPVGGTVTVTVISSADPTKSTSAVVTIL